VEDELLAPEALEMDKDANSNDDPKRDTNCMRCCVSAVVLISQRLQTVETRTDETKTKLVVTTTGMTRRMTPQSYCELGKISVSEQQEKRVSCKQKL
jgi:hypothetical protein